jgi:hypothetical protein
LIVDRIDSDKSIYDAVTRIKSGPPRRSSRLIDSGLSRPPADEDRVLRRQPLTEAPDIDASGHRDLHQIAQSFLRLHCSAYQSERGDDDAPAAQAGQRSIEDLGAATTDEHTVRIGQRRQDCKCVALADLDVDAVGRRVGFDPNGIFGIALDGDDAQP